MDKMKNKNKNYGKGNELGEEGAIQISESLIINTTLTELNLNGVEKRNSREQQI